MNWKKSVSAALIACLAGLAGSAHAAQPRAYDKEGTTVSLTARARSAQQPVMTHREAILKKMEATKKAFGITKQEGESLPMKMLPVSSTDTGGTLLFSDSPEYVKENGILYRDTVTGDARVLYYHLNDTSARKKVAVVLEGDPGKNTLVVVKRGGAGAPSSDYLKVGKETQTAYFNDIRRTKIYLMGGRPHLLDLSMDTTILDPGELVYGVYDFTTDGPVKVTVLMCDEATDPTLYVRNARVLPKDEQRLRGTFPQMDRVIKVDRPYDPMRDGTVYIPLADDKHDLYRRGIDATDGSSVVNYGNYGILYYMDIQTTGRSPIQYYLSPLGGTYAGAMRATIGARHHLLEVPSYAAYFGDTTPPETDAERASREKGEAVLKPGAERADLGTYHTTDDVRFEFSPPGASNLPVNLILMPKDK